jgi:hypothetical protein
MSPPDMTVIAGLEVVEGDSLQLLTATEASVLLKVTPNWVYMASRDGRLPHVRLGRPPTGRCASGAGSCSRTWRRCAMRGGLGSARRPRCGWCPAGVRDGARIDLPAADRRRSDRLRRALPQLERAPVPEARIRPQARGAGVPDRAARARPQGQADRLRRALRRLLGPLAQGAPHPR